MKPLPTQLAEGLSATDAHIANQWWSLLTEVEQAEVSTLYDPRQDSCKVRAKQVTILVDSKLLCDDEADRGSDSNEKKTTIFPGSGSCNDGNREAPMPSEGTPRFSGVPFLDNRSRTRFLNQPPRTRVPRRKNALPFCPANFVKMCHLEVG